MPEITCPQCGYSLETAGSVATTCPRCESTLDFGKTKAAPTPPAINLSDSSSPKIDVAGLMRRVLAEQQPEEDFDAALERIAQTEYPGDREKTVKTIESFLSWWQQRFGISRAEAAKQLAQSSAQLTRLSEIDLAQSSAQLTMLSGIHLNQQGMEKLAPEYRQQLLQQIEDSLREGKPLPVIRMEDLTSEYRQQLQEQIDSAVREGKPLPTPILAGPEKVELADLKIQRIGKLQIEEAIREGKPIPTTNITLTVNLGKLSPRKVLIWTALLLGCLLLAYLLSLR